MKITIAKDQDELGHIAGKYAAWILRIIVYHLFQSKVYQCFSL